MDENDRAEAPGAAQRAPQESAGVGLIMGGAIAGDVVTLLLYLLLICVANAFTADGGFLGISLVTKDTNLEAIMIPSLLLVPVCGGLFAAWMWRRLTLSIRASILYSLLMAIIAVLGAAVVLGEGALCLVLAGPIIWIAMLTGVLIGRVWFRKRSSRLNVYILPLAFLIAAAELVTRTDSPEVVVDEILIHAPPAKVWPHVLAFPEITETPSYWLFRLGLPYPVATTNGGNYVGADRRCIFSDGIVVEERIAEFIPSRRLTFDVTEQIKHPEAYGHITLHRGQFDLRDNGDGTTTLIGSSWYTLHVRPQAYFSWWTRGMAREVHLRVMRHVRRLAEAPPL